MIFFKIMKKLLPALLVLLMALAGCKKDKSPEPGSKTQPLVTVTGISPATVSAGMVVSITGTDFGTDTGGVRVLFNGVAGTVQSITNTEIKAVVPVTTSGYVTVYTGNQISTGAAFTFVDVTALPASGTSGTVVTITGTNFGTSTSGTKVLFNGVAGTVQSVTNTEIKAVVPVTSSGSIKVVIAGQTIIGPVFTYISLVTVTGLSPAIGSSGTVVTITGTNFGTSANGVSVLFNGVAGYVQSVASTEIKVAAPVSVSGNITVTLDNQSIIGPAFTYTSPLAAPYVNGDVTLRTQAEVDAFVALNKGRQLQITGNLYIGGNDITSVSGLSNITSVSGTLSLSTCPLLTDASFLNSITSAGSINFQDLAVTAITMDKLTGTTSYIMLSSCKNLNTVSFKSITGITSNAIIFNGLRIISCDQLSRVDFSSLSSVTSAIFISNTAISNFSGFSSLQTAGSLSISGNPALADFQGLEHLTTLNLPAVTQFYGGTAFNGLYITSNAKLTSLAGLQNLITVPIARIVNNAALNNFCPAKALINKLSTLNVQYRSTNSVSLTGSFITVPALTLTSNGNYSTTADALAAVALCQ